MADPVYDRIDLATLTAAARTAALAAKNKCLADCNKPHTGDRATNKRLHPRHPR